MGNSTSNYERHEDDEQQQQHRIVIGKQFRLLLGQVDLSLDSTKTKKIPSIGKQQQQRRHRKTSSSSSNSTIASSSSSDHHHHPTVSLVRLDVPASPSDSNALDAHALAQCLFHQESYGKELAHVFKWPFSQENSSSSSKFRMKTLPTIKIAAIYYDHDSTVNELNVEIVSETKLEDKIKELNGKNLLSVYTSNSIVYFIQTKHASIQSKYEIIRSSAMSKTALDNLEWLHPFIDYSNLGYRLCGIIPLVQLSSQPFFTIDWLFEQTATSTPMRYDHCVIEYQFKSSSLNGWTQLLRSMAQQEWKLASTFEISNKKKSGGGGGGGQTHFLLFFQRPITH